MGQRVAAYAQAHSRHTRDGLCLVKAVGSIYGAYILAKPEVNLQQPAGLANWTKSTRTDECMHAVPISQTAIAGAQRAPYQLGYQITNAHNIYNPNPPW
jgi:hypothetical protein